MTRQEILDALAVLSHPGYRVLHSYIKEQANNSFSIETIPDSYYATLERERGIGASLALKNILSDFQNKINNEEQTLTRL